MNPDQFRRKDYDNDATVLAPDGQFAGQGSFYVVLVISLYSGKHDLEIQFIFMLLQRYVMLVVFWHASWKKLKEPHLQPCTGCTSNSAQKDGIASSIEYRYEWLVFVIRPYAPPFFNCK